MFAHWGNTSNSVVLLNNKYTKQKSMNQKKNIYIYTKQQENIHQNSEKHKQIDMQRANIAA